jgi:hypothetical protein
VLDCAMGLMVYLSGFIVAWRGVQSWDWRLCIRFLRFVYILEDISMAKSYYT